VLGYLDSNQEQLKAPGCVSLQRKIAENPRDSADLMASCYRTIPANLVTLAGILVTKAVTDGSAQQNECMSTEGGEERPHRLDREEIMPWLQVAQGARLNADVLERLMPPLEGSFLRPNPDDPLKNMAWWCHGFLDAAADHLLLWADYAAPLKFHAEAETVHTLRPAFTLARAVCSTKLIAIRGSLALPAVDVPATRSRPNKFAETCVAAAKWANTSCRLSRAARRARIATSLNAIA
jgi:hypothetical protein